MDKKEYYKRSLTETGFKIVENNNFCSMGHTWELSKEMGQGFYWIYEQKNLYSIKIHDFFFHKDTFIEVNIPECLSVTYYESVSGEELIPYRRLEANSVKTFIGGYTPFKANIHKKIPICCTGIEIFPEYYKDYLKKNYPGEYRNPFDAFKSIEDNDDFPEMIMLLTQIKKYRGDGISAKLFYDAKVAEAVSLIVEHENNKDKYKKNYLSNSDKELLMSVTAYINDHYAFNIKQEQLSQIACMGATKLKSTFKQLHGCTITEYIQHRRMSQAEHLLSCTNFTINQIAKTVGYSSASRFSVLFKKSTGILPNEYRLIVKGK
ncbi:helix-turn-helix domain-containing protein [Anaerovorax odorimutans]|uniref:helix-turn-helix domain-containing protein n=1 Tax=Anaerovorax odorimutans TaxID=109327 RepID=UPI0003F88A34|nr:AraC family transcriptional regulator [Anaerovorax odorimutans]